MKSFKIESINQTSVQKYAIITENDESEWKDELGVSYHFPTKYCNLIPEGTKVIYYKGVCKSSTYAKERMTKQAHYFGIATIGKVRKDPETDGTHPKYFAEILDFIPFSQAVFIKKDGDDYIEVSKEGIQKNYWWDGVRKINKEVYDEILSKANLITKDEEEPEIKVEEYTPVDQVNITIVDNAMRPSNQRNSSNKGTGGKRYTKNTKKIGDRGEEIVLKYLNNNSNLNEEEKQSLIHLAKANITPGYDIQYTNSNKEVVGIEVKATTAKYMTEFVITAHEWEAAEKMKENYYIYLVVDCLSDDSKIQIIQNPCSNTMLDKKVSAYSITKII